MKPTSFEIPQGCTRVIIEQHEDKLVTIFELKEQEDKVEPINEKFINISANCMGIEFKEDNPEARFKDGDILTCGISSNYIIIYKDCFRKGGCLHANYHAMIIDNEDSEPIFSDYCNLISPTLSNNLLPVFQSKLAKVGKVWNTEKKCIEELNPKWWRAKKNEQYYTLDDYFEVCESEENNDHIDEKRYKCGNYFQTELQAKDFSERIKQLPR